VTYGPSTYGDRIAEIYDHAYPDLPTGETVDFLAELAGAGPVLELAIGTGRIALPLAERGVEVHGLDASEAMVTKLKAKPGGDRIPVTIGDMADVPVEGRFTLVYLIFNTFFCLVTQDDQRRCFEKVAEHLEEGGVFVLEVFFPDLARFDRGQRVSTTKVETEEVGISVARHDAVAQRVDSVEVVFSEQGAKFYPVQSRYAFPSELDLMARLAGMRLRERFGGWKREAFTEASGGHVSVYELEPK
jgi:SAM-dependent methyltransferase